MVIRCQHYSYNTLIVPGSISNVFGKGRESVLLIQLSSLLMPLLFLNYLQNSPLFLLAWYCRLIVKLFGYTSDLYVLPGPFQRINNVNITATFSRHASGDPCHYRNAGQLPQYNRLTFVQ